MSIDPGLFYGSVTGRTSNSPRPPNICGRQAFSVRDIGRILGISTSASARCSLGDLPSGSARSLNPSADAGNCHSLGPRVLQHRSVATMYDERKLEDIVLALLHLNAFKDRYGWRAWKGFDWGALDRLHQRGLIGDPKSKAKSVPLTEEGVALAEQLFQAHFGIATEDE